MLALIKTKYINAFLLTLCVNIIPASILSQEENNIWYFGQNAGLDFNNGAPVALTNGSLNTVEACATYCSASGDILFYTDGMTIWNKDHIAMPNGTGLMGNTSTSQCLIVPLPNNQDRFYVFSLSVNQVNQSANKGAYYSEVDLALDGGLGDVTALKNIEFLDLSTEKITAVRHANGIDYWILLHKRHSGIYLSYLLTQSGLTSIPIESDVGIPLLDFNAEDYTGCMKANPSGTIIVTAHGQKGTELLNFDKNTGIYSLWFLLPDIHYSLEFSASEQFLYASRGNGDELQQYDLDAGSPSDIINSEIVLGDNLNWVGNGNGALQMAPDGKIYVAKFGVDYLNTINNPDEQGLFCNYEVGAISLNGQLSSVGLPPSIPVSIDTITSNPPGTPIPPTLTTSKPIITMPNVFTPDGDLTNDLFVSIENESIKSSEGIILNRWGQEVFSGNLVTEGWDGKTSNGAECLDGVYFWKIIALAVSGKEIEMNGFVHLIRN